MLARNHEGFSSLTESTACISELLLTLVESTLLGSGIHRRPSKMPSDISSERFHYGRFVSLKAISEGDLPNEVNSARLGARRPRKYHG